MKVNILYNNNYCKKIVVVLPVLSLSIVIGTIAPMMPSTIRVTLSGQGLSLVLDDDVYFLGYFLMISSNYFTLSGLKCSSTFSDGVNREETGGQERGTVVDSRTARSLRMLLIFVTKKSQFIC